MYYSLQSGRAIAACLVLLYHLGGAIAAEKYFGISGFLVPFSFGGSGVEFFFVLSGFIIYHVHKLDLGKPHSLANYIYKRITRIYPAYLIIFLGVYCLAISVPQFRNTVPHDMGLIIQSLLLVPLDKELVGGTGAPVLVVAWTLQFEMLFYLAFALGVISRFIGGLLIVGYLLGLGLNLNQLEFPFSFLFSEHILLFLAGMLVAQLTTYQSITTLNSSCFAFIGLSLYFIAALSQITNFEIAQSLRAILYGGGCSFIVLAMVCYEKQGKVFLKHHFIQLLGSASYSLYLLHFPLISVLCKISLLAGLKNYGFLGAIIAYVMIFLSCIFISIAFHLFIEKPILEWFKKFDKTRNKQTQILN